MGSYSKTYRATAAPSVGSNWTNAGNIYDSDVNSYASRNKASTSATHINGFGISLPSNATVTSIDVHSKLYSASSRGYIYVYVYSDLMTSHGEEVVGTHVADGKSLFAQYVTNSYSAATLIAGLNNRGIHNGNLIEFLKNLRVRFVIGSTSYLSAAECRVYDNYVVVNYTIPDYTLTVNVSPTAGGTVTGGGKYEVGKTATLTATASSGYRFVKWNDGNTSNPRTVTVSANATYTAQFEKITYTATFKNYDGTVLQTVTAEHGSTPSYTGATPTKAQDAQYSYAFSGWSPSLGAITADTTYTAQFTATKRSYAITTAVSPSGAGSVTGGGTGLYGDTKTLTAKANSGYKFVKWSDGITTASRSVTITGAATYTAVFEPVYVTFDSILNFSKWKNNGISPNGNGAVSDITNTGFTLTCIGGNEGTAASPFFPVEAGKSYKIDIDITTLTPTSGSDWDIYIFFCDANGNWIDFVDGASNRFSETFNNTERIFTAPNKPEVVKAQIRCDANGLNNKVSFSNFRIYSAECVYMGSTVQAEDRSNAVSWDMPTPTRNGYEFIGWNTKPDGGGETYTSASAFPPDDLTLYSQWEALDTSNIYIGTKKVVAVYCGTQKVSVYCGTQKLI